MNRFRRTRPALVLSAILGLTAPALGQGAPPPAANPPATKPQAKRAPPAPEFKMVVEPRAMELLKATSDRLAAAKTMSFTATVGYEYPSKLGPPIVYTVRHDVRMQRPNKLKIITPGDGPASEFIYDGTAMLAYSPAEDLVAMTDAPPTIEEALAAAYKAAAIFYPFADLLVPDPYTALTRNTKLAFVIGTSAVIGGVMTDMLAWANDQVFLQIWIGADDKLPRRIRAVYRADPLRLRHEMDLSNWQLDPAQAPDVLASDKAKAGKPIMFANPVSAPPPGVKPIVRKP